MGYPRVTVCLPPHVRAEIASEARRLDRRIGWVTRRMRELARGEIRRLPTVAPLEGPKAS